ncbi:MAG: hypothetical protein LBO69_06305 [Ignavibacteria bacterium]|jgi:hypothetical protein|nr:hypothetical protein [Ignavibacteria bacterium]
MKSFKILVAIVAIAVVGATGGNVVRTEDALPDYYMFLKTDTLFKGGKEESNAYKAFFGAKYVGTSTTVSLPNEPEMPELDEPLYHGSGVSIESAINCTSEQKQTDDLRRILSMFSLRVDALYLSGGKDKKVGNIEEMKYYISPAMLFRLAILLHPLEYMEMPNRLSPYFVISPFGAHISTSLESSVDYKLSLGGGLKYNFGNWGIPAPGFFSIEVQYLWGQKAKSGAIDQNRNSLEISAGVSLVIGNTTRRIDTLKILETPIPIQEYIDSLKKDGKVEKDKNIKEGGK